MWWVPSALADCDVPSAEIHAGPHLIQLGRPGSDRPAHAAMLFLVEGIAQSWGVGDIDDRMVIFDCDNLGPWITAAERATDPDRAIYLGLAPALRVCPAFVEGDVAGRYERLTQPPRRERKKRKIR